MYYLCICGCSAGCSLPCPRLGLYRLFSILHGQLDCTNI